MPALVFQEKEKTTMELKKKEKKIAWIIEEDVFNNLSII